MEEEKSQLKIGIVLNYVNMILGNLIPIFYTPVMLSLLGQEEYGLYKLSGSITSYLSLMSLGIGSAIVRYLIKSREEQGKEAEEKMFGLFIIIFRIISAVSIVAGTLVTLNLDIWYGSSLSAEELFTMKILVFMMVCNMALNFSQSPYNAIVSAHEKYIFLQCANIAATCVGPLLNIVMLLLGYASVGMVASSLAVTVGCRIAYTVYVQNRMSIKPRYKGMPIGMLREILGFSFWIFVANVVSQLYNATDTVMIGAVPALATTGVAVYSVGAVFNNIVFSLTTGISNLLGPKTNKMVFAGASDGELTDFAMKIGRMQGYIIALIVTGFIAFGKPFIALYAGTEYGDAYWVAILMMVPHMIPLVQSVCLSIIVARNEHRFRSLVYLVIAILNVAGTWLIIPYMGIIGAALISGIAMVLGHGFAMNWYYHKKTGLDMPRFWKEVGKVYPIPIIMCAITLFISRWINFYSFPLMIAGIIVYTAVYLFTNWKIVMNDYEKEIISKPIKRFLKTNEK